MAPAGKGANEREDKMHKVRRFGCLVDGDEYKYIHMRPIDQKVSKGFIPAGFLSSIDPDDPSHPGAAIFLETREGNALEDAGPHYQVSWQPAHNEDRLPIGCNQNYPTGWYTNLDDLWMFAVGFFESRLEEDTLEKLNYDPYVLFGIDDAITQQALVKLQTTAALMCDGAVPTLDEWADYIRVSRDDTSLRWLVQAFAETELPKPWTCYKGIGSIVCYIHSDSGQVMWKHPFYSYFEQLAEFCRQASHEEVMQVRVNRLLWSYEATRVETEHDQDPLICPEYVSRIADIFGYDVKEQGFLVRSLKAQLKVFARSYRKTQSIDVADVGECAEILNKDVEKFKEMEAHWGGHLSSDSGFELIKLANGKVNCVNCLATALCYCLECKDYLCLNCFDLLHSKGARLDHAPFRLVPCAECVEQPAKLHCTFTDRSFCHSCYAMTHIKTLPPNGKENQPKRIDYKQQYTRYEDFARNRSKALVEAAKMEDEEDQDYSSVLSMEWHPFFDRRGVKFYYNFRTGERMRQSPRRVPNTDDRGAEDMQQVRALKDAFPTEVPTTGFDSLTSGTRAAEVAAKEPALPVMRPPFRKHVPCEIPSY